MYSVRRRPEFQGRVCRGDFSAGWYFYRWLRRPHRMCSLSSSKLCCRNLRKVFDDTSVFGKLSVNDFKNICNLLGISISQQGCVSLYQEWLGSSEKKLVFHEFCLMVACYISSNCVSFPEIKYDYEGKARKSI
ncbi:hypothetical protein D915_011001 [Fasciola hepatica]|uniref:EF-hand domain-containing protein n=1 Tax=Fasciola hepatica TaxID=6192 RepID=A0A4E0RVC0_FASHE|nr:hypothetical protein D915_011001 [Fasciola hepatica]